MRQGLRYYKASWDHLGGKALTSVKDDLGGMGRFDGWTGQPMSSFSCARFVLDGEVDTDYAFTLSNWPLFSERSRAMMEDYGLLGFSFHEVKTRHVSRPLRHAYSLMNITVVQNALDLVHSLYKRSSIRDREFFILVKPVISALAEVRLDVFRLEESKAGIYVSERFFEHWSALGGTGLNFKQIPVA